MLVVITIILAVAISYLLYTLLRKQKKEVIKSYTEAPKFRSYVDTPLYTSNKSTVRKEPIIAPPTEDYNRRPDNSMNDIVTTAVIYDAVTSDPIVREEPKVEDNPPQFGGGSFGGAGAGTSWEEPTKTEPEPSYYSAPDNSYTDSGSDSCSDSSSSSCD